jgi:hypothetical protein
MATNLNNNNATQGKKKDWHLHKINEEIKYKKNYEETYKQEIKNDEIVAAHEQGKKSKQKSLQELAPKKKESLDLEMKDKKYINIK